MRYHSAGQYICVQSMIWIKRVVFILFLLIVLVASLAGFVTWKYADDLEAYALDAVRATIVTDLTFNEDVVLSLWKDFPLVAVEISDIQIQDSYKSDTLIRVEKAFVQFNLFKILQNKFTIEGIRVTDGFIKLRRNNADEWNFRVWKTIESDEPKKKIDFSIEILTLENVHIDYDDRMVDLNIQFLSNKSKIKGRFTDKNQRLGLSLNGHMERLTTIGSDRVVEMPLSLAGVLNINSNDNIYTIEMGNAILAGNEMVLDAEWTRIEGGTNMEMKVHAGNIEPSGLLPYIWPQMPENIGNLGIKGRSDVIFSLNGPFTKTQGPRLDATIRTRGGSLIFQNTQVTDLNFEGRLFMEDIKRSKAMEINFDSFELKTSTGEVKGKGTLTDLSNPRLRLNCTGKSSLEELIMVAQVQEEIEGSGSISWTLDFEGPLGKDFQTTNAELKLMRWSGVLNLVDANLKFQDGVPQMEDFNAQIEMKMDKTIVKNCSGKIGHVTFSGDVELARLKEILTDPNAPIELAGSIQIDELDITKLPSEWHFNAATSDSEKSVRATSIRLKSSINKMIYNDFTATNVSGNISFENEKLDITELQFMALSGKIHSDLSFEPTTSGYLLELDSKLMGIDMSRALSEWDNFGQQTITANTLKGRASADIQAQIHLDKNYQLLKDKLIVETDIEISGGELVKFEPLMAMSKFISVDELQRVAFDTIRNQLSIKNSKLIIPKMSVSSNILNVQVFGEHTFNQEMDYHVNLLLNDLLRRKAKKQKTFDGHEIIDEKGKTRLFLWVRGKPGDIKVGFDKREVKQKLKEDFKNEGQTIKQLFQEEFGGKKVTKEESDEVQFRLEEEHSTSEKKPTESDNTSEAKPTEKKKKKKGFFSADEEETETEGGFEIEFDP